MQGAESGAVGDQGPEVASAELAEVVGAWPSLRREIRAAIMALVRAGGGS
ncbi:MAG: hypothetical protein ACKO0W_04180 [Planctomycetota bacterium]